MIKKFVIIGFFLVFSGSTIFSQSFKDKILMFEFGCKMDGLIGRGSAGDIFSRGFGGSFEWSFLDPNNAFSFCLFGIDFYQNKNILGESKIKCTFLTFYFPALDWKINCYTNKKDRLNIYVGPTIAPQIMLVEGTSGPDYSWLFGAAIGIQYAAFKSMSLQFQLRPYLVAGNQLKRVAGVELKASFGLLVPKRKRK